MELLGVTIEELLSQEVVDDRVGSLGETLTVEFDGKSVTFVCVTNGSLFFYADLIRGIDPTRVDSRVDTFSVSSYNGTESTGEVQIWKDLQYPIFDRDVVVVEDIIETAVTLTTILAILRLKKPRSLKVCTLLDKVNCRKVPMVPDYSCFDIDDDFVVGGGLDLDQKLRGLGGIWKVVKS